MFAFALWDKVKLKLNLVRDRFGQKPLYWGFLNKGKISKEFVFTSELSVLRQIDDLKKEINIDALHQYLNYSCIQNPSSILNDFYQLEPGTILELNLNEKDQFVNPKLYKWWKLKEKPYFFKFSDNFEKPVEKLEKIFLNVMEEQMISDVPLGILFSGGIDSTVIALLVSLIHKKDIPTFTLTFPERGFKESEYDESMKAREIANCIGSVHHEIPLTAEILRCNTYNF